MRGTNIDGFIVGELLGSGRTGLLYHAAHQATGQKAIVRVVSREDGLETELFIQEATAHLPADGGPEFVRAQLEDGRIVHLVFNAPSRSASKGSRTALLPPRTGQEPVFIPRPRRWLLPGLLGLVALLAISLLFVVLVPKESPRPVVVVQRPPLRIEPPPPSPPPPEPVAVQPLEPPPAPVRVVSKAAPVPRKQVDCVPDEHWKSNVRQDLIDIETLAARNDTVDGEYQKVAPRFTHYKTASTFEECAAVTAALDQLRATIQKLGVAEESGCVPNERWKRGTLDELQVLSEKAAKRSVKTGVWLESQSTELSRQIRTAATPAECVTIEHRMKSLAQQVPQH